MVDYKKLDFKTGDGKIRKWDESYKEPYFRPGVYVLGYNSEGRVCLFKGRYGLFELPGGGMDLGETLFETAKREFFEETGYKVKLRTKQPIFIDSFMSYSSSHNEFFQKIIMFYEGDVDETKKFEQNLDENEIVEDCDFYDLDSLSVEDFSEMDKSFIFWFKNR